VSFAPLPIVAAASERIGRGRFAFLFRERKAVCPISVAVQVVEAAARTSGIDRKYPAYSIRHALITALFDASLSESQVNAYTGHSNNAHTAATSYFHLNAKWIGHAIASSALSPAVFASADPVVARDDAERQVEEMEE
jgi:site-specific recombinase XerD